MADEKKKLTHDEQMKSDTDDKIANAVAKGISEALPLALAAMGTTLGQAMNPNKAKEEKARAEFTSSDRCEKCLQMRIVCKNVHVLLNVAPANPRRYARFPGIIVNGVTYISPRPGAPIYVPKDNDILYKLQRWEDEEDNLREPHKLDHNSGTLSPIEANQQVNNANPHGFRGMMPGSAG